MFMNIIFKSKMWRTANLKIVPFSLQITQIVRLHDHVHTDLIKQNLSDPLLSVSLKCN